MTIQKEKEKGFKRIEPDWPPPEPPVAEAKPPRKPRRMKPGFTFGLNPATGKYESMPVRIARETAKVAKKRSMK